MTVIKLIKRPGVRIPRDERAAKKAADTGRIAVNKARNDSRAGICRNPTGPESTERELM